MGPQHVVVRTVERASQATIDALGEIGTATVHEAIGRRGFAGPHLRPIQTDVAIAGSAITVVCHAGDNLMVHAAVEVCRPGDVLVVTTTAPSSHGMFGELLAGSLMARGVRGLVIDAGVRDTRDLRAMGFPVWSAHVSCQGAVKATAGSVNVPVVLGDQIVRAGAVVCCDDDGVVVVTREEADEALARSRERLDKERASRERLNRGELGLDMYGLRATLSAAGVVYVDTIAELDSTGG
jgi:4-hydroxy-4-methyl-2-oxoglutarate aldolase